tara:strand:+ start:272 stop:1219 length:948 start_codon:yes stop_codon:yes gene_type:complete
MINVSIIGNSNIARKHLIPAFNNHPSFNIVNIASRSKRESNEDVIKYFENYEQAVNQKDVDLIYVSLPNSMHYEICEYALKKNKHVIVEKSLTTSNQESKRLIDLAKKNELILFENFQFQFHDQFQFIKNIVMSSELGSLKFIDSSFMFPPFQDEDNIRYKKDLGGGSLLDAGAYPIMITNLLVPDEDLEVISAKSTEKKNAVDISGAFSLISKDSLIVSHCKHSFNSHYACSLCLTFTNGQILADRIFTAPPGFKAKVLVSNSSGTKTYYFECNHFIKMLDYIVTSLNNVHKFDFMPMIRQSKLLHKINKICQN